MPTNEIDLFSWNLEPKKIKNKVRLIELFAGIGAQAKSLEMLGVDFEHYKLAEWAVPSIIAYNSIHIKDTTDYSQNKTLEEMLERINGVSTNYNEPIAFEKLKNKPIERIRNVYNNCIATHNLVNIMNVKGKDLEIVDKDKYEYILTYSFPCQDLSLAGKRAGMSVSQSEGGTRSGLLWEVARILNELERERALPQILLCENVPEIMSEKNMKDLQKWVSALEKLGYKSYDTILNAKNYGLPQNRRRFFMISILGEYSYEFPNPISLKWKLKDFLEKEVDEKYYLSEKMVEYISATNEKWTGNNNGATVNRDIACTINTAPGQRRCDSSNYIADNLPDNADLQELDVVKRLGGLYDKGNETHQAGSIYDKEGLSPTLDCSSGGGNRQPFITEQKAIYGRQALNETLEKCDVSDGTFIDAYHRSVNKEVAGAITTRVSEANNTFIAEKYSKESLKRIKNNIVEGDISPTITANAMQSINHQNCVLLKRGYEVEVNEEQKHSEGIDIVGNHSKSGFTQTSIVGKNGIAPTVTENHGQVTAIPIKNNTKQGFLMAEEGDGVNIGGRMQYQRGTVQKGITQSITTTGGNDIGVVVKDDEVKLLGGIGEKKSNSGTQYYEQNRIYDSETVATSIPASPSFHPNYYTNLRIRKLTPRECMRLMGFQDRDTEAMYNAGLSNSAIYHCAGDSICVNVLMAIFAPLFDKDWRNICQLKNF